MNRAARRYAAKPSTVRRELEQMNAIRDVVLADLRAKAEALRDIDGWVRLADVLALLEGPADD